MLYGLHLSWLGAGVGGVFFLPEIIDIFRAGPRIELKGGWGTVYVFEDVRRPHLLKVGTTKRLSGSRKKEVSKGMTGGADLRQIFAVDMPFARVVEGRAHEALERYRHRSERGREWYSVPLQHRQDVFDRIMREARIVRRAARRQGKWSAVADDDTRTWLLAGSGVVREHPFSAKIK